MLTKRKLGVSSSSLSLEKDAHVDAIRTSLAWLTVAGKGLFALSGSPKLQG
jgi:hypothetical protein